LNFRCYAGMDGERSLSLRTVMGVMAAAVRFDDVFVSGELAVVVMDTK
jgi:hypothetical protein